MMDLKPSLSPHMSLPTGTSLSPPGGSDAWEGRSIAGPKLRLCDFTAFLEQQRDSETVSPSACYYDMPQDFQLGAVSTE